MAHKKCSVKVTNYKDRNRNKDVIFEEPLDWPISFVFTHKPGGRSCCQPGYLRTDHHLSSLPRIPNFTDEEASS